MNAHTFSTNITGASRFRLGPFPSSAPLSPLLSPPPTPPMRGSSPFAPTTRSRPASSGDYPSLHISRNTWVRSHTHIHAVAWGIKIFQEIIGRWRMLKIFQIGIFPWEYMGIEGQFIWKVLFLNCWVKSTQAGWNRLPIVGSKRDQPNAELFRPSTLGYIDDVTLPRNDFSDIAVVKNTYIRSNIFS